ncbi:MAG: crotonase/enoyl-CoA hydratase family protein [Alphaproteobacteria bacterium]|nr:crotonase/enoyl-CoA hydratase family protein [Alphaproteobacteria bacterium]
MGKWFDQSDVLKFSVDQGVARITLNRPDKRNALSGELISDLRKALLEADDRADVRVSLLSGEGASFCSGYDLNGPYGASGEPDPGYRSFAGTLDDDMWNMQRLQDEFNIIFDLHKPVIAKVHGAAFAGGADLALQCDMVLMAQDAKIGFPAARANGAPPFHMWLYLLGPQWTKRLLLTGDVLTGLNAARLGLVMDAVPADELDAEADELARRIALCDPELLSAQKRNVNMGLELMGWRMMQRLSLQQDAHGHLSRGPRRSRFRSDAAEYGIKTALTNRDQDFGDGIARPRWPYLGD